MQVSPHNKITIKILSLMIFSALLMSCSSTLILTTEPTEVDVFLVKPNGEEKLLGKSPLQIPLSDLEKEVPLSATTGEMIELNFVKKDFESQKLWVPGQKAGLSKINLYTKLKPGSDQAKLADSLLQYLHNAQKFASNGSYERALQEVDLALTKYPNFIRGLSMKGAIYFAQAKWDESQVWYEKALALDNGFDEAVKMIDQIKLKKSNKP